MVAAAAGDLLQLLLILATCHGLLSLPSWRLSWQQQVASSAQKTSQQQHLQSGSP
jgi:hypothetical protein